MTDARAASESHVEVMTGGDRMQWEADVGPFPQHIGVLMGVERNDVPVEEWSAAVAARLGGVARLGRRPVRGPVSTGWLWVDDDRDPARHVTAESVPVDGDRDVWARAVDVTSRRLPAEASPWHAYLLLDGSARVVAVVVVLHHALVDGVSGLAVLGALADGVDLPPARPPSSVPAARDVLRRVWHDRALRLRKTPDTLRAWRSGWQEIRAGGSRSVPRSTLNRPTGPRRHLAVVQQELAPLLGAAHRHRATLNDVLLVAVADAVARYQRGRGEMLTEIVVSVPVAVTDPSVRATVGNADGAVPIPVPTQGPLAQRLSTVSSVRSQRLAGTHGRSLPLILASFRVLSALRLVRWFVDHQRLVNTFLTNVRGPDVELRILDTEVRSIVPVVANQGNQAVSFAALSYRGGLAVAVTSDQDLGVDADVVAELVRDSLVHLASLAG